MGRVTLLVLALAATPTSAHEADRFFSLCLAPGRDAECERTKAEFRDLYKAAYYGDYPAQRNAAYMLQTGAYPVVKNMTASCTWRLIIVNSDSDQVDDCGRWRTTLTE